MNKKAVNPASAECSTESTAFASGNCSSGLEHDLPCLVVAWSARAPDSVGEFLSIPSVEGALFWLGRGAAKPEHTDARLEFLRQRPGEIWRSGWQLGPRISRRQLVVRPLPGPTLEVQNVGRCPMLINGEPSEHATIVPGDVLELSNELLLCFTLRPSAMPRSSLVSPEDGPPFGHADKDGFVGESPAAWRTRERILFLAGRAGHVLILGESGTGKELAAQALHRLSASGRRPMIARNAATFPPGLIDAELFGNVKDYPNAGQPARPGLIGAADGSSLFLDEIGELPLELQNHLLRVLDSGGEYQRLGESQTRSATLRLIAATNRPIEDLKADLTARFPLRLVMPSLNERRDDIPLLVRHLLGQAATKDAAVKARFFEAGTSSERLPRVAIDLMRALIRHQYSLHLRELAALLWASIVSSPGDRLELTTEVRAALGRPSPSTAETSVSSARVLSPESIQQCLDRHEGVQEKVWRELGMKNRYVLKRLIKKHGLRATSDV